MFTFKAHSAAHGKATVLFENALKLFLQSAPTCSFEAVSRPRSNSIRDRLKNIIVDRCAKNSGNEKSSRNCEEIGERAGDVAERQNQSNG